MASLTDALIKTALLPQQQQPQVVNQRVSGPQGFKSPEPEANYYGIPDAPTDLPYYTDQIAAQSMDYFKGRQDLEMFAKNMWKYYNIDVTNPDPSRPEAVLAAQTFNQELANLRYGIDAYKNTQKRFQELSKLSDQNLYQFNQGWQDTPLAFQTPDQSGYSTEISPELKFAQGGINRTFDSSRDYRNAQADAQMYQGLYNTPGAQGSAGIQSRAAQTLNPMMNVPAPSTSGSGDAKSVQNYVDRLINHKYGGGNWDISKTYTEGGEVWRESKDYAGTRLGKRTVMVKGKEQDLEAIVEKTVRNPQTGEVKWVFTNKSIPPESITNVSSNQLLETVSSNNAKYPSVEKVYEYVKTVPGVTDDQGNLIDDMFVAESTRKQAARSDQEAAAVPTMTSTIASDIEKTKPLSWFGIGGSVPWTGSSKQYNTPYGKISISANNNNTITVTGPDGKDTEYPSAQLPIILRAYQIDIEKQGGGSQIDW